MPTSKSGKPIRKKTPNVENTDQFFSQFQESATRYELEKTAALVAAFVVIPDPDKKP